VVTADRVMTTAANKLTVFAQLDTLDQIVKVLRCFLWEETGEWWLFTRHKRSRYSIWRTPGFISALVDMVPVVSRFLRQYISACYLS